MFRSLSARIFILLAAGLVLIQIISLGAFLAFRGHETKARMLEYLGADVAFKYNFIAAFPPEQRAAKTPLTNQGYFTFTLEPGTVPASAVAAVTRELELDPVTILLRQHLPENVLLGVRRPSTDPNAVHPKTNYAPPPFVENPTTSDYSVEILMQLPQEQIFVLHLSDPFGMPGTGTLVGYLLLLLLAVSPFAWIAVRMTTKRSRQMAEAIKSFGHNLGAPPLEERGPTEVVLAARAFNAMRERILRQIDERTQILAAISHDLQTPLTRLRLRAETLTDEDQRDKVIADVEHMAGLVREGLDFARSAHLSEEHSSIEVNHWLDGMVDDALDTGACCTLSGRALAPYKGAPRALTRALQNLIDNAIKFGGGAIIEVADSAETLTIRVRDRGPGLADDMLEKVFEPFVRGESSRNRATGGTGLGLAIARNLVRAHGGDVVLANDPHEGLVATVSLPRIKTPGGTAPT